MSTPEPSTTLTIIPVELEKAAAATALSKEKALVVCQVFAPFYVQANELLAESKDIAVNAPIAAKLMRLRLKAVRCAAETARADQNDEALTWTKSVNVINRTLKEKIEAEETRLSNIEQAELIAAEERRLVLKKKREDEYAPYGELVFDASLLKEEQWVQMLAGAKAAKEAKIAEEKKAEEDRIAAEKAEAEARAKRELEAQQERERMRIENERLAKIAADERKAREEAARLAKIEQDKKDEAARVERNRLQAIADEERKKAAAEKAALEKKLADERAESARLAKIEADRLAKIAADEKAKAKAEAARIRAEKAAAKKAAAAPDREKLKALASTLSGVEWPSMATEEGRMLMDEAMTRFDGLISWLQSESEKVGVENELSLNA